MNRPTSTSSRGPSRPLQFEDFFPEILRALESFDASVALQGLRIACALRLGNDVSFFPDSRRVSLYIQFDGFGKVRGLRFIWGCL